MGIRTTKLMVYGTLLYGEGNWAWALADAKLVKQGDIVKGYSMRTHGGFPACFEAAPDSEVTVDVFELEDLEDFRDRMDTIDGMEFGCGYFRRLEQTVSGEEAWMYVMPIEQAMQYPYAIDDGNWKNWCDTYQGENY